MPAINLVRKGEAPPKLDRAEFRRRFLESFSDPAFDAEKVGLARLEAIAWDAYSEGRKSPVTRKAGAGFADPDYDLSVEWLATRERLHAAERIQADPASASRILIISGSARNDGTCPGEISKSYRLSQLAREVVEAAGCAADYLDLSLVTSEYGRRIHPCKGCVSTAMPLCHWPCSCYPNHSLNQVQDWMAEIYERWTAAHGVIIITPVYWYQSPTPLKLMVDRLVCADGGNPDPTSTGGKKPEKAKQLELAGWDYPQHLAGRVFGVMVHGDVAGIEGARRSLCDWLGWMGLIEAGPLSQLDRFIGYYEPYATSHATLDADQNVQEETRNIARAVANGVKLARAGQLKVPDAALRRPRPK